MKVLSIKEPFATLISNGKKCIETRSWKTSYRGELYIHASKQKMAQETKKRKELMNILKDDELNYEYIICKCNLTDCIYMDKDYVEKMKHNNYQEYICGEYKEGRYAWKLENITPLDEKIKARGNLSIWNFYDEFETMDIMNNIEYGWVDKNKNIHNYHEKIDNNTYILQSPNEIIKNKVGICFDQVELERSCLKNTNLNIKTYFIAHYEKDNYKTHTFLTFEKDNNFYWFEHAWEKFKGINKYKTQNELLKDVLRKFIKYGLKNQKENTIIREYKKPKSHISIDEFLKHCEKEEKITLD